MDQIVVTGVLQRLVLVDMVDLRALREILAAVVVALVAAA